MKKIISGLYREPVDYIRITGDSIRLETYIKEDIYRDYYETDSYKSWDNEYKRKTLMSFIKNIFNRNIFNKSILVILDDSHSWHVYNALHKGLVELGYKITKTFDEGRRMIYEIDNPLVNMGDNKKEEDKVIEI